MMGNYYFTYRSRELFHHGIKGQQWGVKHGPPYPLSDRDHGKIAGQDRNSDIRIKKGAEVYRVQSVSGIDGDGSIYVSLSKSDHVKYLGYSMDLDAGVSTDRFAKDNDNENRPYSVTLKLNEDMIIPSYNKTMEAFLETFNGKKSREIHDLLGDNSDAVDLIKGLKKFNSEDYVNSAYIAFVGTMMQDTKAKEIFFSNLKNAGYNAIVDDWDVELGKNKDITASVIAFDRSGLKQTSSTAVTEKEAKYLSEMVYYYNEYLSPKSAYYEWFKSNE